MDGYSIKEIASALSAKAVGAVDLRIVNAAEPALAGPYDLAMAMSPQFAAQLSQGRAKAAVLAMDTDWQSLGLDAAILVERPRVAMAGVTQMLDRAVVVAPGLHPTAEIDPTATVVAPRGIGAFVVIGADVVIGANAQIAAHVSIGPGVQIGANAVLHAGTRIQGKTVIGDNFICQPGVVVGGDGFSFVTPEKSGVEAVRGTLGERGDAKSQSWLRIHSIGGVSIGDNVEVGANATIDQGTIRATMIGDGTKIDSQVQIGHNVVIGRDCLVCAQAGIAGSANIGNHVVLGGQSGVADNINVGDDVIAGGGTKILANVPAGRVLLGYPAMKMDAQIESYKALRRLPKLANEFKKLQEIVSKLGQND